jgi:hypothetical protein
MAFVLVLELPKKSPSPTSYFPPASTGYISTSRSSKILSFDIWLPCAIPEANTPKIWAFRATKRLKIELHFAVKMSQNLRAQAKAAVTPQLPSNKRKATLGDAKVQSMLVATGCCNDLSTARDALYEVHDVLLNYNASKSTRKATANNLMKVLQHLDKAIVSKNTSTNSLQWPICLMQLVE